MSQSSLAWFIGCGGLLGACSTSGVTFSGVIAEPAVESADVVESSDAVTELGLIEARCEVPDDSLEEGLAYGDLVCSEALLRRSMRDTTAFVGGTHLSDIDCEHDDETYECSGRVLRREPDAGTKALARKAVFDPWSIEVRLRPAPHQSTPSGDVPRPAEMVPRVPVSDLVIGEVFARCDGECATQHLHDAIASGARYAGARHFGFPECRVSRDEAPGTGHDADRCRSWASAYQVDLSDSK